MPGGVEQEDGRWGETRPGGVVKCRRGEGGTTPRIDDIDARKGGKCTQYLNY